MNSVRQNTTLCNGSLLKFNMKTKNPVGTLDVHYPRFASVLSCSLSRLKKRSFPLAQEVVPARTKLAKLSRSLNRLP